MSRRCSSLVCPVVWTGSARDRGSFRVCLISTTCLPVTSISLPRSSVERRRGWRSRLADANADQLGHVKYEIAWASRRRKEERGQTPERRWLSFFVCRIEEQITGWIRTDWEGCVGLGNSPCVRFKAIQTCSSGFIEGVSRILITSSNLLYVYSWRLPKAGTRNIFRNQPSSRPFLYCT